MSVVGLSALLSRIKLSESNLSLFFAKFKDFCYDPSKNDADEFRRLSIQRKWNDKNRKKHWTAFLIAFGDEVDAVFGSGEKWDCKYLCMVLRAETLTSMTKTKKVFYLKYI